MPGLSLKENMFRHKTELHPAVVFTTDIRRFEYSIILCYVFCRFTSCIMLYFVFHCFTDTIKIYCVVRIFTDFIMFLLVSLFEIF